jgi:hypothetical protein
MKLKESTTLANHGINPAVKMPLATHSPACRALPIATLILAILAVAGCGGSSIESSAPRQTPNILFIIMDDVGIDQMKLFDAASDDYPAGEDYPASRAPNTPNILAIADNGIRFSNTWSMPAPQATVDGECQFCLGSHPGDAAAPSAAFKRPHCYQRIALRQQ